MSTVPRSCANRTVFPPTLFFIATHGDVPLPSASRSFAVIGLGGHRPKTLLPAFMDNTGDTISQKNIHYSELSGWYWIWKNLPEVSTVGLCHYRRYFLLDNVQDLTAPKIYMTPNASTFSLLTGSHVKVFVERALAEYDVIVPRRQRLSQCISEQYINHHHSEDWDHFLEAIEIMQPDLKSDIGWFERSFDLHAYNMMIAPRRFFDTYMEALFAVLTYMEQTKPFRTEPYQCRVPAFIAERFFSLYLFSKQIHCLEVPMVITSPAN